MEATPEYAEHLVGLQYREAILSMSALNGHRLSSVLRYGGKDSISPGTLLFADIESKLGIYTLHIFPDEL